MKLTVEVVGLEVHGRHGVLDDERAGGQILHYDIALGVPDAALSDRIEDAVDYRDVATAVEDVSGARDYHLLEALAAAVAETLVERFPVEHVRVRVRKPRPPGVAAEYAAATVERHR